MQLHIGFLVISLLKSRGGIERVGVQLGEEFARRGHKVTLFYKDSKKNQAAPLYEISPKISLIAFSWETLSNVPTLRDALIQNNVDILVALVAGPSLAHVVFDMHGTGIPLLISEHNNPRIINEERWNFLERNACLYAADSIHILSEKYRSYFPCFLQDRLEVIPNPSIIIEKNEPPPLKEKIILSAGRFEDSHKQFSLLIKAFSLLAHRYPDWRLIICGDGKDGARYKKQISYLKMRSRIALPGSTSEMDAFYRKSAFFCIPSRYEGFPLVALEAHAAGLPVVGFASCSGVNDIVVDGVNGFLAHETTANCLAENLEKLMTSPETILTMGAKGRDMTSRYDARKIFDRWEALICKTIAQKNEKGTILQTIVPREEEERATAGLRELVSRKLHPYNTNPISVEMDKKLKNLKKTYKTLNKRLNIRQKPITTILIKLIKYTGIIK